MEVGGGSGRLEGEGGRGPGREGGVIDQRVRSAVDGGVSGGEASEQVVDGDALGTNAAAISTVVVVAAAAAVAAINNRRVTTLAVPKLSPWGLRGRGCILLPFSFHSPLSLFLIGYLLTSAEGRPESGRGCGWAASLWVYD